MQIPARLAKGGVWGEVDVTVHGICASRDLKTWETECTAALQACKKASEDRVWRSRDEFHVSLEKMVRSECLAAVALRKALH